MTKTHILIYSILVFLVGLMAGALFLSRTNTVAPMSAAAPPRTPEQKPLSQPPQANPSENSLYLDLQSELAQERTAREQLHSKLQALSQQVSRLEQVFTAKPSTATATSTQTPAKHNPDLATDSAWMNEQVLLDAGMSVENAMDVKKEFEKLEMDKLYLRDRATREGWIGTSRYVEELETLSTNEQSIRERIGEDNYGAYLYATGQPNQVYVESMLQGSPAQTAGIKTGDVLVRYDNTHIYTWNDVRSATAVGQAGEQVQIVLNRDGQTIQTYITRGPLGIRMGVRSQQP